MADRFPLIVDSSSQQIKEFPSGDTLLIDVVNIDGGTIDGVTIGGSSAGAITGTTGQFNTSLNVDGTVTADGLTVDGTSAEVISVNSTANGSQINFDSATTSSDWFVGIANDATDDFLIYQAGAGSGDIKLYTDGKERVEVNNNGDIAFYEDTGTTPKFFWDASAESLLVGTDSGDAFNPSALIRGQGTDAYIQLKSATTNSAGLLLGDTDDDFVGGIIYNNNNNYLYFHSGNEEAMRIDASGNLLVGTTDTTLFNNTTGGGVMLSNSGSGFAKETSGVGDPVVYFNNTGDDGQILDLRKNGTSMGSIGTTTSAGGTRLAIGAVSDPGIIFAGTGIFPATQITAIDNVHSLGSSSYRWKDLYLSGGVYFGDAGAANLLDDYEEGTWTPTLSGSTGNPSVTYTKQQGEYVKVGKLIHVSVDLRWSAQSGGSGNASVSGFPFASTDAYSGGVIFEHAGITYSAGRTTIAFEISHNASSGFVLQSGSGSGAAGLDMANVAAGTGYLIFSFTYIQT